MSRKSNSRKSKSTKSKKTFRQSVKSIFSSREDNAIKLINLLALGKKEDQEARDALLEQQIAEKKQHWDEYLSAIKHAEDDLKKEIEKQNRLLKENQDKILKEEQDILKAKKDESNKNIKRRNTSRALYKKSGRQQNFDLKANQEAWFELRKEVVKAVNNFPIDQYSKIRQLNDIEKRQKYIDEIIGKEPSVGNEYFDTSKIIKNFNAVKSRVDRIFMFRNPEDSTDEDGRELYPNSMPYERIQYPPRSSRYRGGYRKLLKKNKKTRKCKT